MSVQTFCPAARLLSHGLNMFASVCPSDDFAFYAQLAVTHATDSIVVTGTDGRLVWVNNAFQIMSGYTLEEVRGQKPGDLLQGDGTDRETVASIRRALQERRPIRCEIYNYTKSSKGYWIELSIAPIFDQSGMHTHFMAVERDITERRKLEARAASFLEQERFREKERRGLSKTSEWLYAARTIDELLTVTKKSMQAIMPAATGHLYFYSNSRDTLDLVSSWGNTECLAHFGPDDCWGMRRGRAYAFGTEQIQFTCSHVQSEAVPYFCLPLVAHGETIGMLHLKFPEIDLSKELTAEVLEWLNSRWETAVFCVEQISLAIANVNLRTELLEQSTRDQLTGLWNRRWFLDTASREFRKTRRMKNPFSLISLDVDHFKSFNDHHGHEAGDMVLKEFGSLLYKTFGDKMSPCRVGGEEFMVICPNMTADSCVLAAEKLRLELRKIELKLNGRQLPPITVSQGISCSGTDSVDLFDLMRCADEALYAAKAAGRDCIKRYVDVSGQDWKLSTQKGKISPIGIENAWVPGLAKTSAS